MLVGLIRTIFFFLIFYYAFKFIGRYVMPFFLKKGIERMQKQQDNAANVYKDRAKKKEGTVTIQTSSQSKKSTPVNSDEGEYVDFEEVK